MEDQTHLTIEDWAIEPADKVVYELFLRGRGSTPQAAAECGLSDTEFRSRVDRLHARRLLRPRSVGDPEEIEAVSPQSASVEITMALQRRAQRLSLEADAVRNEFSALESVYRDVSLDVLRATASEILMNAGHLSERLNELCLQAHGSLAVLHPLLRPADMLQVVTRRGRPPRERGISYRLVFRQALLQQPKALDDMKVLVAMGIEIRTVPVIPVSVILVDRETTVVPLGPGSGTEEILLHDLRVAHFAHQFFEHVWGTASPFTESAQDKGNFDDLEMAILSALRAGLTDEKTARQLGISTRTLRRYLAGLSERLGTETRFQLGVAAAEAGLFEHAGIPLAG